MSDLNEQALAMIASEISDAIAAHDSGEQVNATERARHVLSALPASPPEGEAVAWSTHDVLRALCDATEHLLRGHGCDRDGYETWQAALAAGRRIILRPSGVATDSDVARDLPAIAQRPQGRSVGDDGACLGTTGLDTRRVTAPSATPRPAQAEGSGERQLAIDVLRCIPADGKPNYGREWGKLGAILAEFIDDLREGRYPATPQAEGSGEFGPVDLTNEQPDTVPHHIFATPQAEPPSAGKYCQHCGGYLGTFDLGAHICKAQAEPPTEADIDWLVGIANGTHPDDECEDASCAICVPQKSAKRILAALSRHGEGSR